MVNTRLVENNTQDKVTNLIPRRSGKEATITVDYWMPGGYLSMREGMLRKKDLGLLAITQPADDSHTSTIHIPHLLCMS